MAESAVLDELKHAVNIYNVQNKSRKSVTPGRGKVRQVPTSKVNSETQLAMRYGPKNQTTVNSFDMQSRI